MQTLLHADARFATANTNLAACLGALRVPIKLSDPCSKVKDGETGKVVVTFYFEERGEKHEARKVQWAWDNREKFESLNAGHALSDMRRALEKLEWLTKLWHGNITAAARAGDANWSTDDIGLAACVMAEGYELHSFVKPLFHFQITEEAREILIEEYECFRHGESSVANARRALECRSLLLGLVKRAPLLLHYTHGDPLDGGRDGYIAAGASREELEKFFNALYAE